MTPVRRQRRLTLREHLRLAGTGALYGTLGAAAGLALVATVNHLGWLG